MDIKGWPMLRLLDPEVMLKIKMAWVFGTNGNEAIIITKEDEVLSFGTNNSGCLGLGNTLATLRPMKIEAFSNIKVKGFAFGKGSFVVALTEKGEIYSWGKNDCGQLGNNTSGQNVLTPNRVGGELMEKQVVEIACGENHTLALTAEGEVYFWGKNNSYSNQSVNYGQNVNSQYQVTPKKVKFDARVKNIAAVACGGVISMALTQNGQLYGWGHDSMGQLGLGGSIAYYANPSWISSLEHVVITKVACGYAHTLAISDLGELFAWGDNTHGQLGIGTTNHANKPVLVTSGIGRVVDIAALYESNISAAETDNSEIYIWGLCRGQSHTKPMKTHFTSLNDAFASCSNQTPVPIIVDVNAGPTLADSIKKAFDDPVSSDLKIMVEQKPIHVHKSFLKIRCNHLQAMFQEQWQEGNSCVCEISHFSYKVYRSFLEYLYTDEVKLPVMDALELLDLANSYLEEQLKKKCVQIIKRGLSIENAALVYGSILNYDTKELEDCCLKFCVNRMAAIIKTEAYKNLQLDIRVQLLEKGAEMGAYRA